MRNRLWLLVAAIMLACPPRTVAASLETAWTITLRPGDFIIGPALKQLHTRHAWAGLNEQSGLFEVALRKTAAPIPAPKCRMDYLILTIPAYYPETPKQASASERRAVYDALLAMEEHGSGSMTARVEAPLAVGLAQKGAKGMELTACNLFFVLPLSVQVSE